MHKTFKEIFKAINVIGSFVTNAITRQKRFYSKLKTKKALYLPFLCEMQYHTMRLRGNNKLALALSNATINRNFWREIKFIYNLISYLLCEIGVHE